MVQSDLPLFLPLAFVRMSHYVSYITGLQMDVRYDPLRGCLWSILAIVQRTWHWIDCFFQSSLYIVADLLRINCSVWPLLVCFYNTIFGYHSYDWNQCSLARELVCYWPSYVKMETRAIKIGVHTFLNSVWREVFGLVNVFDLPYVSLSTSLFKVQLSLPHSCRSITFVRACPCVFFKIDDIYTFVMIGV